MTEADTEAAAAPAEAEEEEEAEEAEAEALFECAKALRSCAVLSFLLLEAGALASECVAAEAGAEADAAAAAEAEPARA